MSVFRDDDWRVVFHGTVEIEQQHRCDRLTVMQGYVELEVFTLFAHLRNRLKEPKRLGDSTKRRDICGVRSGKKFQVGGCPFTSHREIGLLRLAHHVARLVMKKAQKGVIGAPV